MSRTTDPIPRSHATRGVVGPRLRAPVVSLGARLLAAVVGGTAAVVPAAAAAQDFDAEAFAVGDSLEARVWLDRGDDAVLRSGDDVRIYYRTSADAYAAIFRIDTDGRISLLFPQHPEMDAWVGGGRDYRLLLADSPRWRVRDDPGMGYFFMVASTVPLDFSSFGYDPDFGWDLSTVGDVVYEDPYVAIDEYVAAILPEWELVPYGLDFLSYSVDEEHDYPRFMCYDCHGYRPYTAWNPYAYQCSSVQVVVWNDPYFAPRYRYWGTRVVFARPFGPRPRYGFTARVAGAPRGPIVRVREAPPRRIAVAKEPSASRPTRRGAVEPSRRTPPPSVSAPRSAAVRSAIERIRARSGTGGTRAEPRATLQRRPPSDRAEPRSGPGATGRAAPSRAPVSRATPGRSPTNRVAPSRSPTSRAAPARPATGRAAPNRPATGRPSPGSGSRPSRAVRPRRPSGTSGGGAGPVRAPSRSGVTRGAPTTGAERARPAPRSGGARPQSAPRARPQARPPRSGSGARPAPSTGSRGQPARSGRPRPRRPGG